MGIGVLGWAVVGFARIGYDFFADDDAVHSVTAASATFGSFEQVGADMGPVVSAVGAINSNGYQYGVGGELRW